MPRVVKSATSVASKRGIHFNGREYGLKSKTYELVSKKTPALYKIRTKDVRAEIDGKLTPIRYSPSQSTILTLEQTGEVKKEPIWIEHGRLQVHKSEHLLQMYLDSHPDYGVHFIEYDEEKDAMEELKNEELVDDAIALIREYEKKGDEGIETLESVALAFGYEIEDRSMSLIKRDLRNYARKHPKDFMEAFESPFMKSKALAFRAINNAIVKVSDPNYVRWSKGGGVIVNVPTGKEHADVLANFMIAGDKGMAVSNQIEDELNK